METQLPANARSGSRFRARASKAAARVAAALVASVIGFTELLNNARNAQALTYNATPVVAAALIYLVMLWPLVRLVSRLEHKSIAVR